MSALKKATLDTIAEGVAKELFEHELKTVADNIADPNTSWLGKRKITLEFTFAPDESRQEIKVMVQSKSALEPIKGVGRTVWMGKSNGKNQLYAQDTLQTTLFDEGVTPFAEVSNA